MDGKITLITPPDIFENELTSILLIYPTDKDQDTLSLWLKNNLNKHINIYFYSVETNIDWLLYAASKCDYKFIDIDNCGQNTKKIISYLLGKKSVFYKTNDTDTALIFNHINQNKITNIETFLEKTLNDQNIK